MAERTVVAEVSLFGKIASYIEIMVRDPHSTVFVHLCDVYRKLGLIDEAIEVARKGTVAVPDYPDGYIALGRALAEKNDLSSAATAFRTALTHDPQHVQALTGLAQIYLLGGQPEEAAPLLNRARELAPDDHLAIRLLAGLPPTTVPVRSATAGTPPVEMPSPFPATEQSQTDIPSTEPAADLQTPPISTATIADIYIRQGFPERALKVYTDLLLSEPDNIEIRKKYEDLHALVASRGDDAVDRVVMEASSVQSAEKTSSAAKKSTDLIAVYQRWLDVLQRRRAHV